MSNLPIIQKTYDFALWYIPILNKLPRDHRFLLGDRIISGIYELLESLIQIQYEKEKLLCLKQLNGKLDVIRHQTRLLMDFKLLPLYRYNFANQSINNIGRDLGGWIKQQQQRISR